MADSSGSQQGPQSGDGRSKEQAATGSRKQRTISNMFAKLKWALTPTKQNSGARGDLASGGAAATGETAKSPPRARQRLDFSRESGVARAKKPASYDAVETWLQLFPWLVILNHTKDRTEQARAHCSLCKKHNKSGQYTSADGAVVHDQHDLKRHHTTGTHKAAALREQGQRDWQQSFSNMKQRSAQRFLDIVPVMLVTVAWMIGNAAPMSQFAQQLLLFRALGFIDLEHKFNHSRYVLKALHALSEALMAVQLLQLKASPFFTLLFDLSSDVGNEEHMLVYVRSVTTSMLTVTHFLCCVRVLGKTGEQLAATVLQVHNLFNRRTGKYRLWERFAHKFGLKK
eukprot:gene1186-1523_t